MRHLVTSLFAALFMFVCSFACAQTVSLCVDWTSNQISSPIVRTSTSTTNGPVASDAILHIRLQCPYSTVSASVTKLIIHERAGHVADPTGTGSNLNLAMSMNGAHTACGDPPNGTQGNYYYDFNWATYAGHNGVYDITVQARYTVVVYYPPSSTTYTTTEKTLSVDVQNIIVLPTAPVNPEPILWDPDTMTQVPFACTISHARTGLCTVRYEIFKSDQTLIFTKEFANVTRPGGHSWNWAPVPPATVGDMAPKGVYLWRTTVINNPLIYDTDCDKSSFITITVTPEDGNVINEDYVSTPYTVRYTINSQDNRAASSGHIDLYDKDNQLVSTQELETSDLTPGNHEVLCCPSNMEVGTGYRFLVSVYDAHSDLDKGHRQRWALQHNQAYVWGYYSGTDEPFEITYSSGDIPPEPVHAVFKCNNDTVYNQEAVYDKFTMLLDTTHYPDNTEIKAVLDVSAGATHTIEL